MIRKRCETKKETLSIIINVNLPIIHTYVRLCVVWCIYYLLYISQEWYRIYTDWELPTRTFSFFSYSYVSIPLELFQLHHHILKGTKVEHIHHHMRRVCFAEKCATIRWQTCSHIYTHLSSKKNPHIPWSPRTTEVSWFSELRIGKRLIYPYRWDPRGGCRYFSFITKKHTNMRF